MGDGRIFQKSLRGFFFNKYLYQMNLVSAGSIPLDSTFNRTKNNGETTSEAFCRFSCIAAQTANGMCDKWQLCVTVQRYWHFFDKKGNPDTNWMQIEFKDTVHL